MLPTRITTTTLFLMFVLDILYIHRSLAFSIRTAKVAAKEKRCPDTPQMQGFPPQPKSVMFSHANATFFS